jgi:hypothetical protein
MALLGGVVDLTCHKMLIPQRYFGITQPVQGFLEQTQLCMHDIRADASIDLSATAFVHKLVQVPCTDCNNQWPGCTIWKRLVLSIWNP